MTSDLTPDTPPKSIDNLRNRFIFGFAGFFLMMGGMLYNHWTYGFVFLVICGMCLWEFYRLLEQSGKKPLTVYGTAVGIVLYGLSFLIAQRLLDTRYYFLVYPFFSLVFIIKLYDKHETQAFTNISLTLLGLVYVAIPFSMLHIAVFSQGAYSYQVILGTFFIIWIHDIGAYFVGYRYGKTKLFERISPKKSWEGGLGGLLCTAGMIGLHSVYLTDLSWQQWSVIGGIVVIIGTYGDLVESMLKRSLLVKDSSGALPGHGGFLDRFDNLLLCAPFIALFLKIF
jgi:phosphatidate cytidylyltransferase